MKRLMTILISCGISLAAFPASHDNKVVDKLLPPDWRPCTFFTLQGVVAADPSLSPSQPWFALSNASVGYKEMYALLLAAKLSSTPLVVTTSGVSDCGAYPNVIQIYAL